MTSRLVTNEEHSNFQTEIVGLLADAVSVRIASGYIGHSTFTEIEPRLREIVSAGGHVSILIGLGFFEGLTEDMLTALRNFDNFCRALDETCGVSACARKHFHGKLYVLQTKDKALYGSVGSSNFSSTGFGGWLEGNLFTTNATQISEIIEYIDRLYETNAEELVALPDFPIRGRKKRTSKRSKRQIASPVRTYREDIPDVSNLKPDFTIPLRYTEKSSLNLFMGKVRCSKKFHPRDMHKPKSLRRKIEVCKKRSWYEVEITMRVDDISKELRDLLPDQTDPWRFDFVTAKREVHNANFKVKKSGKYKQSLKKGNVDFMTHEREALGPLLRAS